MLNLPQGPYENGNVMDNGEDYFFGHIRKFIVDCYHQMFGGLGKQYAIHLNQSIYLYLRHTNQL